jgi:hypothetical protein
MTAHPPTPNGDEFAGFAEAQRLLSCHQGRTRTLERLAITDFFDDEAVVAVHVDNIARADRDFLTAFDAEGHRVGSDVLYTDEPGQHLDLTPEFDHVVTGLDVRAGSELAALADAEEGWIIDMEVLRGYDPVADRRGTQKAMVLAHLADMLGTGEARGFVLGSPEPPDEDRGTRDS